MEHLKPSNLFILTLRLAAPHKELSEFCRRCYEVCAHTPSDAGAVVIADNGFRAVGAIAALEQMLQRPIVSANQELLWATLEAAGGDRPPSARRPHPRHPQRPLKESPACL